MLKLVLTGLRTQETMENLQKETEFKLLIFFFFTMKFNLKTCWKEYECYFLIKILQFSENMNLIVLFVQILWYVFQEV